MHTESLPAGPDKNGVRARDPGPMAGNRGCRDGRRDVFSLDESNWPNYATIVWTDAFDMGNPSDLARPGVFRVNIGLGKDTYTRLVGEMERPDYRQLDRLIPHPLYAKQHWAAILNPSRETFDEVVLPLLSEAHDRLVAVRERQERLRDPNDAAASAEEPND